MLTERSEVKIKSYAKSFAFLLLSLMLSGVVLGQIKSGVISGIVTDSNGAIVPGAAVTLINQDTNVNTTVSSDEAGSFTFPYLAPGKYTVKVETPSSNFSTYIQTDIEVATAQTVQVEIKLKAGEVKETV